MVEHDADCITLCLDPLPHRPHHRGLGECQALHACWCSYPGAILIPARQTHALDPEAAIRGLSDRMDDFEADVLRRLHLLQQGLNQLRIHFGLPVYPPNS